MRYWLWFVLLCLAAPAARAGAEPVFFDSGPDTEAYGAAENYPPGPRVPQPVPQKLMVGHYSHFGEKYPSRVAAATGQPSPWQRAGKELELSYNFKGATHDLPDYLSRQPVTGLLIARGDTILFEHYQYGRTDKDHFLSQSMAKTITAMLVGIAVEEGAIRSIDQTAAEYVPDFVGTEHGRTPLRAFLHMASGIAFKEVYDAPGDNQVVNRVLFGTSHEPAAKAVTLFDTRVAPPDTRFNYAGDDTEVLGLALTQAVKMPMTAYLESRIWRKLGAEADALWTTDSNGQEIAFCCLNVVLRDWARLGEMLANDGAWNGQQIVPRQWVLDATSVQAPFLAPRVTTGFFGYGYQTWLFPGGARRFAFLGVHGQAIFVDPATKLVLVHTAVRMKATGDPMAIELYALWNALLAKFGG